jgi:hypothetical protein
VVTEDPPPVPSPSAPQGTGSPGEAGGATSGEAAAPPIGIIVGVVAGTALVGGAAVAFFMRRQAQAARKGGESRGTSMIFERVGLGPDGKRESNIFRGEVHAGGQFRAGLDEALGSISEGMARAE